MKTLRRACHLQIFKKTTTFGQSRPLQALKLLLAAQLLFALPLLAAPTGGTVTSGSASISQIDTTTNIDQSTSKAIINWQGFGIANDETVNFNQPGASAVALNRVIGNESSLIQGALNATGKVFLINSAGVTITNGASINTAGFLASTLDIDDDDFLNGVYNFSGDSDAEVINLGTITVTDGGYVVLLGKTVSNQGVITATTGTVALASGNQVSLNFNGDSLVAITIDEGTLDALVENGGAIYADGGNIILTAKAADGLLSAQVNNSGILQAQTVDDLSGTISLLAAGGTTTVDGTLDASAPTSGHGGFIETSGDTVTVADSVTVTTLSASGENGTWLIDPDGYVIGSDGDMTGDTLTTALETTDATIESTNGTGTDGDIDVNDEVSWSANTLTLTATNNINVNNVMTATGTASFVGNYGTGNDADDVPYGLYTLQSAQPGEYTGKIDFNSTGTVTLNDENYTVINNVEDWQALFDTNDTTGNYVIGSDFMNSISGKLYSIATLYGNLNGFGHVISYSGTESGLIDSIAAGSTVSNLGFDTSYIWSDSNKFTTTDAAGILANTSYGSILNSFVSQGSILDGDFSANANDSVSTVGGLVGINYGLIANSYVAYTSVNALDIAGGLVGINGAYEINEDETITGIILDSSVIGSNVGNTKEAEEGAISSATYIGGFAGVNKGTIKRSYTNTTLKLEDDSSKAGSFVGLNSGIIAQSYATLYTSNYSKASILAGFVYENSETGKITDAYTTTLSSDGRSATWNAGFVYINSGTIKNAYTLLYSRNTKNDSRYAFVFNNTGGTISNSYWYGEIYYKGSNTPITNDGYATQLTTDTLSSLYNQLASYKGAEDIWSTSTSGDPILKNLTVYVTTDAGTTYGEAINDITTLGLTVRGLQRDDNAATFSVLDAAVENGYIDAGSYTLTDLLPASASYTNVKGLITITPKSLTLNDGAIEDKTYDGTTDATISSTITVSGYVADQTLDITYSSAEFEDKNAGEDKTVSLTYSTSDGDNGGKTTNYIIADTTTATIAQREVSVNLTADDKTYDGSTDVITGYTLVNTISDDDLSLNSYSALFADANAGEDKTVTASDLVLSGDDSSNYVLIADTAETTADISQLVIIFSGITTSDDTSVSADDLLVANLVDGDTVNLSGSVTIDSTEEGAQTITDLSNLTADNSNYTMEGSSGTVTISSDNQVLDKVVSGTITISTEGTTTTIDQDSASAIINWLRFNIAADETVAFDQLSSSSVVLNRITGSEQSVIEGALTANGKVFIINSNGIVFAAGSSVNVAGLVASSLNISNTDFLNNNYVFTALSDSSSVIAKGDIVIVDGGLLALVGADGATNTGSVRAEGGDVLLVAAEQLTLTLNDSDKNLDDYSIENLSGTTKVAGSIRTAATGGTGGLLETAGSTLDIDKDFSLYTGNGGTWSLTLPSISVGDNGTVTSDFVTSNLERRNLVLNALEGDLDLNTSLDLSTDTTLTLSAGNDVNINADITVSGENSELAFNYGNNYNLGSIAGGTGRTITYTSDTAGLTINGNAYTLIWTIAELASQDGSGYYALANDIDASATSYSSAVIATLSGALAGLGHTISDLTIDAGEGSSYVGLVGTATEGSDIRDLALSNVTVSGWQYAGTLVGYSYADIQNITASGTLLGTVNGISTSSEYLGGLIGCQEGGRVSDAHADVDVTAAVSELGDYAVAIGGLIGRAYATTVSDSSASGDVTGNNYVGGLIGNTVDTTTTNCYATGNVTGVDPDGDDGSGQSQNIGGLIGSGGDTVSNCYATGDVTGGWYVGGLIGSGGGTISNSYATGNVTSNSSYYDGGLGGIGGLIGDAANSIITDSYAIGNVNGSYNIGGLIGTSSNNTISGSYATGDVSYNTADYTWNTGGLIGSSAYDTISDSYATGDVTGYMEAGGLIGNSSYTDINESYATGDVSALQSAGGLVGIFNNGSLNDSYATGDVTVKSR